MKFSDTAPANAICAEGIKSQPQKTAFDLQDQRISNEGLSAFRTHNNVTWLNLRENGKVTDAGMTYLKHLPLETLDLTLTGITSSALKKLPLSQMRTLSLGWTDVDDAAIPALDRAKNLKTLILEGTKIEGTTLGRLQHLKNLQNLNLNSTKVTHAAIQQLGTLKLQELDLDNTAINNQDLKLLVHKPLQILSIRGTAVSNDGLVQLQGMSSLKQVYLKDCAGISREGTAKLKREHPGLLVVH
jgi:Leucine-rich repeat (LRR) protein